ncbi:serine hydrolase domain-containing protein [Algiphilus sp.]|uniref:serine hydrolase domain-containing protein n=1 Tax=Algiphilus sp. TaxID=1872431 RepID=UPI001CA6871F|nr:serine hydrolase domain-containing protein [Algiphilus sp.]MBY8965926.1 beta-lactamase family protein [Algiphilus acroporae]MCI5062451.1 beta-lactamase family protein [Algiphilus sp.]MCI5104796.1 beta-lactamase family protein [Algiphilus sp.]
MRTYPTQVALLVLSAALLSACGAPEGSCSARTGADDFGDEGFASLRNTLDAACEAGEINEYAFELGTADRVLARLTRGNLDEDRAVFVASAGKPVAAAVILSLVEEGTLELDVPIARWLQGDARNTDAAQRVTLRQLLNHTSGLPTTPPCLSDAGQTLARCATSILRAGTSFAPGSRFDYGGGSYQVAGLVAQQAANRSWQQLVDERVADPLEADLPFTPLVNPRIAGGIVANVRDLGDVQRAILGRDPALLSATNMDRLRTDQVAGLPMQRPPGVSANGYSFGLWFENPEVLTRSDGPELSAPGLLGTVPWHDDDLGYYAVIVLSAESYREGLELQRALRDRIPETLP